ncbi:hypothetical protein PspLS_11647 [Pyricularia sp. CBS 133598]|nr:hypothetical protein PspLS_11647 [Pyricularia sp. CBS 133598]
MEFLFREYIQSINNHEPEDRLSKFITNSNLAPRALISLPASFEELERASDVNLFILHILAEEASESLGAILAVRVTPKTDSSSQSKEAIVFRRHIFCKFEDGGIFTIDVIDDVDALRNKESQTVQIPTWTARQGPLGFLLRDAYRSYFECVSNRTMDKDLINFTHDQIIFNGHQISREQYRGAMEECHDVMADCKNTMESLLVNEGKQQLMARVTFEWTPIKPWNGIVPTGKMVKFSEHFKKKKKMQNDLQNIARGEQDLAGKLAIVTGSSRGIGRAIAIYLASRGANIIGTCATSSSLSKFESLKAEVEALNAKTCQTHSPTIIGVVAPLTEPQVYTANVIGEVKKIGGTVNILIQNAALVEISPIGMISEQDVERMLAANIAASVFLVQGLLPYFGPDSRIINISSEGARDPSPLTFPDLERHQRINPVAIHGTSRIDLGHWHLQDGGHLFHQGPSDYGYRLVFGGSLGQARRERDGVRAAGAGRPTGGAQDSKGPEARNLEVSRLVQAVSRHDVTRAQAGGDLCWGPRGGIVALLSVDEPLEESVECRLSDAECFLPQEEVTGRALLGQDAHVAHDAQVDRYCFEPLAAAVVSQGVLVCVTGRILCLARVAVKPRDGGANDEEVQRPGLVEIFVEVPSSLDLGPEAGSPPVVRHLFEYDISQRHGHLDHTFDGGKVALQLFKGGSERSRVRHVAAVRFDHCTASRQVFNERLGIGAAVARSRKESQVPSAGCDKLPGETTAQAAQSTDEKVRDVGVQFERVLGFPHHGGCCCCRRRLFGGGERKNHLAHVFALLDGAEGLLDLFQLAHGQGTGGTQGAGEDEVKDLVENLTKRGRILFVERELVEKGCPQQLTGQRVEDAIDTAAVGDAQYTFGEAGITRVEYAVLGNAVRGHQQPSLGFGTNGNINRRPQMLGNLHSGLTDPASGRPSQIDQGMIGSRVADGDASSLLERHCIRYPSHDVVIHANLGGVGTDAEEAHAVADFKSAYCLAPQPLDDTTALLTQDRHGNQSHGCHNVSKVDARGCDFDLNLVVGKRSSKAVVIDEL